MNIKRLEKKFYKIVRADYPACMEIFCDIVDYQLNYLCGEENTTITVNFGVIENDKVKASFVAHLFYTGRKSTTFLLGMFYQAMLEAENE